MKPGERELLGQFRDFVNQKKGEILNQDPTYELPIGVRVPEGKDEPDSRMEKTGAYITQMLQARKSSVDDGGRMEIEGIGRKTLAER